MDLKKLQIFIWDILQRLKKLHSFIWDILQRLKKLHSFFGAENCKSFKKLHSFFGAENGGDGGTALARGVKWEYVI
jgi:hypothetical protein